ncbi:uncharacterized membrane protein At3g27390-like isoform X2 [Tripterygium wilfordii]|uniref:uncharacterized membrane protein At3g27390-like isoform X2 n=1 Tax=Tripterygium wilfordii TaxID=458696 RepID=UPI0018F83097|nr:uncharacterized membrane protein At3g27390-like isoform X2 [Tripterygium wilfordii]
MLGLFLDCFLLMSIGQSTPLTNRFDEPFKVAILLALPALFGIWLGLSIVGSVIAGVGYGFFNPWVASFEAFRHENESKRFIHCIVDGTWDTVKGSCTVVRDFADMCHSSYPQYLKELHESPASNELQPLRLVHVPGCIMIGVMGLIVDVPLYTAIAVVKSPFMLFKGWFRLIHDLLSREGPFLETACIPIAGLTILLWPIVVVGSIIVAVFSSVFIGLYGSVIVYQERSFRRGFAYVVTMVAEFDEYTNDWLYLREGTLLPKPHYRKKRASRSSEFSVDGKHGAGSRTGSAEAPAMLVPSLAHSRSVREAIQEVKMLQIWESIMRSCEIRGKELLDTNVLTPADLYEWSKGKDGNDSVIIGVGLPCYSLFQTVLYSIKVSSNGLLLVDGIEVTNFNRPKDKLLDWFFNPVMVLKEQIRAINLGDNEVRFLEKVILFGSNTRRMEAWDNGSLLPQDPLRAAQIQGISRRMTGMVRSVSKLPTYRRRFRQVVKTIISYSMEKEVSHRSGSMRSVASIESV